MKTRTRMIKNALISLGGNDLRLVDVVFADQIEQVIPRTDWPIEWREIATKKRWERFKHNFPVGAGNEDIPSYDAEFLLLMPGAIDAHVHFNTPGFEHRDDFAHGSLAAACGGVTTVLDMPCTSIPPVTSAKNLELKLEAIKDQSWVDFGLWGGISGRDFPSPSRILQQIEELFERGVVGFKAYLISGMETFTDLTLRQMEIIASILGDRGAILAVHAEDKALVQQRQQAFERKNLNTWQAYCEARDDIAEAKAVRQLIQIAKRTGCRVHIVHLSSKLALEQIVLAQSKGVDITAETCPHYLYFTEDDFKNDSIANYLKTAPPVKKDEDRTALWLGLGDGSIAFVTTDHAGCDPINEKSSWNFWEVYGGIPGVEHRVPFLFSEGFKKDRLTLARTIELLATNVAETFELDTKGDLSPESDADFALINLWDSQVVKAEHMHSKGKYTPFESVVLNAVVQATFVRGKLVFDRNGRSEVALGYGEQV
ncbi:MAG: dihydroorotase [candidate division KSB1 bacterium]|nr:dihydroorotase [candidate division KSB1 bacterium]MDZ7356555.1 dihydroorotase [candidate division KSB1 bacterium]